MAAPTPSSQTRISQPTGNAAQIYIQEMPKLPQDVKDRFPSMAAWEVAMKEWVRMMNANLNVP
jgi:hypothetical protein